MFLPPRGFKIVPDLKHRVSPQSPWFTFSRPYIPLDGPPCKLSTLLKSYRLRCAQREWRFRAYLSILVSPVSFPPMAFLRPTMLNGHRDTYQPIRVSCSLGEDQVEDLSRVHGVVCSPGWHYMDHYARDKEPNGKYSPWDAFIIAMSTDMRYSSKSLMISSAPRTLAKRQWRRRSSIWMRMRTFLLLAGTTKWIRRRLHMPIF